MIIHYMFTYSAIILLMHDNSAWCLLSYTRYSQSILPSSAALSMHWHNFFTVMSKWDCNLCFRPLSSARVKQNFPPRAAGHHWGSRATAAKLSWLPAEEGQLHDNSTHLWTPSAFGAKMLCLWEPMTHRHRETCLAIAVISSCSVDA